MQMNPTEPSNNICDLQISDTISVRACLNRLNPAAFELDIATVSHERSIIDLSAIPCC